MHGQQNVKICTGSVTFVPEFATSVEECVLNVPELYAESSRTWNMFYSDFEFSAALCLQMSLVYPCT